MLTIYSSEISGYTGIAIKGGTVNIIGSEVTGHGAGMDAINSFANSGFNDTGDAVYIETNYDYPIELNITDLVTVVGETTNTEKTVLTGKTRYALRVHDPKADCVDVNIVSGTFTGETMNCVPDQAMFETYLVSGSELTEDGRTFVVAVKAE